MAARSWSSFGPPSRTLQLGVIEEIEELISPDNPFFDGTGWLNAQSLSTPARARLPTGITMATPMTES